MRLEMCLALLGAPAVYETAEEAHQRHGSYSISRKYNANHAGVLGRVAPTGTMVFVLKAAQRTLLMVLVFWALLMIIPDLWRVVQPLGSFGFYANDDGLIYNVTGPFDDRSTSPAWNMDLREGDQLDLSKMRCLPYDPVTCRSVLIALGGVQLAVPGRSITLDLVSKTDRPLHVSLIAKERPTNFLTRGIIFLDQIVGILVVLAAAWLVWTRPGPMTWGFFLYVMWFNPGQSFQFYALLQEWPIVLLAQNMTGCIAQAVGFTGLLLFVLRVPNDESDPRWRWLERVLPLIALLLTVLLITSYGSAFGYRTEWGTRAGTLTGLVVAASAFLILIMRRRSLSPVDYQRLRWVIWGCLLGLPSFLLAELASETTLFITSWGDFTPSEDIIGLLYLVNGVLCLLVFEAIRRPRVVNVAIPLRRVTILGLLLSAPALLLHHQFETIQHYLALPGWAWLSLGAFALFLISQLHEGAVSALERLLNRPLDRLEHRLSLAMRQARKPQDIDCLLANEPCRALELSSATTFRRQGSFLVRDEEGEGWEESQTRKLSLNQPMLAPLVTGQPFAIKEQTNGIDLPPGLRRPVLAIPAADPVRCFALSFYGPHAAGTDLDANERAMLSRLARLAAAVYAELEGIRLRHRIAKLEQKFKVKSRRPSS
jgi:hypothetical protein